MPGAGDSEGVGEGQGTSRDDMVPLLPGSTGNDMTFISQEKLLDLPKLPCTGGTSAYDDWRFKVEVALLGSSRRDEGEMLMGLVNGKTACWSLLKLRTA